MRGVRGHPGVGGRGDAGPEGVAAIPVWDVRDDPVPRVTVEIGGDLMVENPCRVEVERDQAEVIPAG